MASPNDQTPLLNGINAPAAAQADPPRAYRARAALGSLLAVLVIAGLVTVFAVSGAQDLDIENWWLLRGSPEAAATRVLSKFPVIDGHIDLPEAFRTVYANNVTASQLEKPGATWGHVDIPRLRHGKVGAFFWSVYVDCKRENENFTLPSYRVRDTLEQIDVSRELINKYSDTFELASSSTDAKEIIRKGKIASWLGVEGGHQLGNSFSVLRQYYALGARYMTLTHSCHNAFADSAGILKPLNPPKRWGGLSSFGVELVKEMNRLGMLVDLSHTSDDTAHHALNVTRAPVMWSHSSARSVWNVPRNVPDDILRRIGKDKYGGQVDGVVMVNFAPFFVAAPGNATVQVVADHIEHIANVAGKAHVGIGSDYDGIDSTPRGLEDVSTYPNLFAELISRNSGWTAHDLAGLAGGNILRVMGEVERIGRRLREEEHVQPSWAVWEGRRDLKVRVPAASEL